MTEQELKQAHLDAQEAVEAAEIAMTVAMQHGDMAAHAAAVAERAEAERTLLRLVSIGV
jgi:hypothetical protein